MERATTVSELRRAVAAARGQGLTIGLVPTLGALHEGHLANVRTVVDDVGDDGFLVVSVFVNPLQFGPGEDCEAYPRDLDGDAEILESLGPSTPDLLYAPTVAEMYPGWPGDAGDDFTATSVHVESLTERLCGASRPGHFDGVATVVTKLLDQVRPDVAAFGRKDFQQLQVVRRLVTDLDLDLRILATPTVREAGGLAMSSRNAYLSEEERTAARCVPRALSDAVRAAMKARAAGERPDPNVLRDVALATISAEPRARIDYVDVVDPVTLQPPDQSPDQPPDQSGHDDGGEARQLLVAVAVQVGPSRLIDNVVVGDEDDEQRLLDATTG